MRLYELKPSHAKEIVKNRLSTSGALQTWLRQNDYIKLGEGYFSEVWGRGDSTVAIKFNTWRDKCYRRFNQFCREHKGDPHLPKMSPIHHLYTAHGHDIYVVFLEKLNSVLLPEKEAAFILSQFNKFHPVHDQLTTAEIADFAEKHQSLLETLELLRNWNDNTKCWEDLNKENIMQRKDGTIVITDPWAAQAGYATPREPRSSP